MKEDTKDITKDALWRLVAEVPGWAQKQIKGGRLNGMTDISPIWRLHKATELWGACGDGWKVSDVNYWVTDGAEGQKVANCSLNFHYKKDDGQWSEPSHGIGGSMLVAKEKNGLYTSDEAFKMAHTDAISVALKALGFGARIYMGKSENKYPTAVNQ